MGTVGSDDRGVRFWHRGRQWSCRRFVDFVIVMPNCWPLNESWTVDITELLIQKLSAVFPTKNLLELGIDECDNLNFMNINTDSFKIRKNSWILGIFKIRILNLCFQVQFYSWKYKKIDLLLLLERCCWLLRDWEIWSPWVFLSNAADN